jgi:hypothetical protein
LDFLRFSSRSALVKEISYDFDPSLEAAHEFVLGRFPLSRITAAAKEVTASSTAG